MRVRSWRAPRSGAWRARGFAGPTAWQRCSLPDSDYCIGTILRRIVGIGNYLSVRTISLGNSMAYRIIAAAVFLFASTASAARVSVVVEGADDRADEIASALRSRLAAGGHELVDAAAPTAALDD